jgi:hypothetical protein
MEAKRNRIQLEREKLQFELKKSEIEQARFQSFTGQRSQQTIYS